MNDSLVERLSHTHVLDQFWESLAPSPSGKVQPGLLWFKFTFLERGMPESCCLLYNGKNQKLGGLVNSTPTPAPRFGALQHRNFLLLWAGLIVSNVGSWMQNVAEGWLILQLTNSPLWIGLLGLSFALPMIVLPLFPSSRRHDATTRRGRSAAQKRKEPPVRRLGALVGVVSLSSSRRLCPLCPSSSSRPPAPSSVR